jgi:hypothetical protein
MGKWNAEIRRELLDAVNLKMTIMAGLVTHLRRAFGHVTFTIKAQFLLVATGYFILLQMLSECWHQIDIANIKPLQRVCNDLNLSAYQCFGVKDDHMLIVDSAIAAKG